MSSSTGRPAGYSGLQKLLHWLIALMVFTLIPVGMYMGERGKATNFDALTNQLYTMHKTFGTLVLLLVVLRVIVRISRGTPAPESSLTRLQVIASEAVHGLLYLLLLAVPLIGWAGVSAYGARGIVGGFNLPEIIARNEALGEKILDAHGLAAFVLAFLVLAHFGAALFHRLILKDGVLKRMLP
jgi:cytochrome b561